MIKIFIYMKLMYSIPVYLLLLPQIIECDLKYHFAASYA